MENHATYRAQLDDWLTRLASDVRNEVHVVSTEEGARKDGHELVLDRPLPELLPHPNPLAAPAEHQHGTLYALRFVRAERQCQAGYVLADGEVKWLDVTTLNGHVLLFLLGDLEYHAYTVKPSGMSLEQAREKRYADLAAIAPIGEPIALTEGPNDLDEDF